MDDRTPQQVLEDDDWPKRGTWDLPTDPDEFLRVLSANAIRLEDFLRLPAAQPMPPELRAELARRAQS